MEQQTERILAVFAAAAESGAENMPALVDIALRAYSGFYGIYVISGFILLGLGFILIPISIRAHFWGAHVIKARENNDIYRSGTVAALGVFGLIAGVIFSFVGFVAIFLCLGRYLEPLGSILALRL